MSLTKTESSADLKLFKSISGPNKDFSVPEIEEFGLARPVEPSPFHGGETEALKRFEDNMKNREFVLKVFHFL